MHRFGIFSTLLVCLNAVQATELNELNYITEISPPYNYRVDGELTGYAVELLLSATALAGRPIERQQINVQPWARAYRTLLEGPNCVLFSMTRTPEREALFKWAGPIGDDHVVLLAKKSLALDEGALGSLSGLRIGAIRNDVGELYLREQGLVNGQLILGVQPEHIAKMLVSDRLDLWAYDEYGARLTLGQIGADPDDYKVVRVLKSLQLYFAFSKDVDDRLVNEMQAAIDQLKPNKR